MKQLTIKEMNNINGGACWALAAAIVAIDLGLIGTMWAVYMSNELGHDNPCLSAGASGGGGGAG
ncbi:MAG: bacteriocin [bacterium]